MAGEVRQRKKGSSGIGGKKSSATSSGLSERNVRNAISSISCYMGRRNHYTVSLTSWCLGPDELIFIHNIDIFCRDRVLRQSPGSSYVHRWLLQRLVHYLLHIMYVSSPQTPVLKSQL